MTPGRLETHEDALVGAQLRASTLHGSYLLGGSYVASPPGDSELDFEQDLFGAVRVLRRAQVALLVPILETFRRTPLDGGHVGGGLGDVNLGFRYDLVDAGALGTVPGIALLAGLTAPTGTAPESATLPLRVDETGIGAWQANLALALEQTAGPWLVDATAIVAARTPRFGETLGPQTTIALSGAYTLQDGDAVALSASYAFEGDASAGGVDVPFSSKRVTTVALTSLWPLPNHFRLLAGVFVNPPWSQLGANQPALAGVTLTLIRGWCARCRTGH